MFTYNLNTQCTVQKIRFGIRLHSFGNDLAPWPPRNAVRIANYESKTDPLVAVSCAEQSESDNVALWWFRRIKEKKAVIRK